MDLIHQFFSYFAENPVGAIGYAFAFTVFLVILGLGVAAFAELLLGAIRK